jgi:hypothetical protein
MVMMTATLSLQDSDEDAQDYALSTIDPNSQIMSAIQ